MITNYAKNLSSGSGRTYFTYLGNVVPFNDIVTTLVTDMHDWVINATAFNQPLNSWNTANVLYMHNMFYNADAFNQPLNSWNTSNVTIMAYMFTNASVFNQDISNWIITSVIVKPPTNFSTGSALSAPNSPLWN